MIRSKKKRGKSSPARITKLHIFFLGVVVGIGIFWVPSDHEFSPAQFTHKQTEQIQPIFGQELPTTAPLIQREGYTLAYNGQTRNAHWVYHKLTNSILKNPVIRGDADFKEDLYIPEHIRASKIDYKETGFDRGHLCPAADCPSQQALENSFFLSNISPQNPSFNRGYWKMAEQHVRDLTKEYQAVHVFSGPLYLSSKGKDGKTFVKYEVIGPHHVAVPTHFFMLIYVEQPTSKLLAKAYIMPNQPIDPNTPLKKFSVSVEEVESASGIVFTQILKKEKG